MVGKHLCRKRDKFASAKRAFAHPHPRSSFRLVGSAQKFNSGRRLHTRKILRCRFNSRITLQASARSCVSSHNVALISNNRVAALAQAHSNWTPTTLPSDFFYRQIKERLPRLIMLLPYRTMIAGHTPTRSRLAVSQWIRLFDRFVSAIAYAPAKHFLVSLVPWQHFLDSKMTVLLSGHVDHVYVDHPLLLFISQIPSLSSV